MLFLRKELKCQVMEGNNNCLFCSRPINLNSDALVQEASFQVRIISSVLLGKEYDVSLF